MLMFLILVIVKKKNSSKDSTSSTISTVAMQQIVDRLKTEGIKSSTKRSYYSAWKSFNQFFIRLDEKPDTWEDRLILFIGYLIQDNKQSQTIRCYVSAIKKVLRDDDIILNENKMLISSLTKACKIKNDRVRTRLPIQKGMLRIIIQNTRDFFETLHQQYLADLYQAMFSTAYFGLLRVGEIASGSHPILVNDVEMAANKKKIMLILRTSKTHGLGNKPQKVKISSTKLRDCKINYNQNYCPYKLLRNYINRRPRYLNPNEPFFVFSDRSAVSPDQLRKTLKTMLRCSGFDDRLYSVQSFRAGRAVDLNSMKISIESIKSVGRWASNSVFTY